MLKWSKAKRMLFSIGIIALVIGVFSAILSPFIFNASEIEKAIPINIGNAVLMAGFYMSFILAIISSFGFLYSSGYLDKNIDNYIVLPINRRAFVLSKLIFVYYNVMTLIGLICVPFIIIYLFFSSITINGIISIIIYFITMPILVISIVAAILGTLLYFINKVKNKALARNILYAAFFLVAFGTYMVFVLSMTMSGDEDPLVMISSIISLVDKVSIFFFYPGWASDILNGAAYLNILYMIITIMSCGILLLYFEKVYLKGAIGFNEGGKISRRKKRKISNLPMYSPTRWFFIREAKEITKTGTYFFNTIFGNVIIVVVYLGMMGYSYFTNDMPQEVLDFIDTNLDVNMIIIITIVVGTFFAVFNNGAATVFSRDAKVIDFINTLPINQSRTFFGKVLFHSLIEFFTLFIFMIIPMLVLQIKVGFIIVAILVMIIIVAGTIFIPVCVDLAFPTLDWESETTVVKRGRSIWINMIATLILNAVVFGLGALLFFVVKIDYTIISYIAIGFYILLFVVLLSIYRKLVVRAFRKVK